MSTTAYCNTLNDKLNKILELLISSENLCKLLYYNCTNPLEQAAISNPSQLIYRENYQSYNKIFPLPKYPNAETNAGSLLYVVFSDAQTYKRNTGFKEINLRIDVASHLDIWCIDSGLRVFSIMNEVDKIFNDERISDLSYNKVYSNDYMLVGFSDYFWGYSLKYVLSDNSNIKQTVG